MDCLNIPDIEYGDFSKRIHEKVIPNHTLLSLGIELTFRCNLRCKHCYVDHSDIRKELTREEISNILDQAASEGALWLLLTGGEPMARKDFKEIYIDAKKKGFLITIFTNGTLITPEIAEMLAEYPPMSIEVSLYGASKEVYEAVTEIPGSYEKCMNGIELLTKHKLPFKLKSVILTLNKSEMKEMRQFSDGIAWEYRYDAMINPGLNGSQDPSNVALTPREVVDIDINDEARFNAYKKLTANIGSQGSQVKNDFIYSCGAGVQGVHIDPYGMMGLCILARKPSYSLRGGSLSEGWREFIPKVRAQKRLRNYKCAKCEITMLCEQCPGWAQVAHDDDQEKPVEYLCQVAHLRAKALGVKVNETVPMSMVEG